MFSLRSIAKPLRGWSTLRRSLAVYAWGNGDSGQLGLPEASLDQELETFGCSALTPRKIEKLSNVPITQISSSAAHTAFVGKDGSLWTCGLGQNGQLGHGNLKSLREPLRIRNIPFVKFATCGNRHTLALTRDGEIYAFGCNKYGQLGIESQDVCAFPLPVFVLQRAGQEMVSISAGDDFSAASSATGEVYTWGSSKLGRLGHPSHGSSVPGPLQFLLGESARCERTPRLVRDLPTRIATVHCGQHHTIALTGRGRAFAWGSGRHFQLGTGDEKDREVPVECLLDLEREEIVKVSAGGMHSLILCKSGRVYSLGMNEAGSLGIGYEHANTRSTNKPVPVIGIRNAKDIAAGWHVSAAVVGPTHDDGCADIVTWGCGNAGALGTGDPVDHWEPVQPGVRGSHVAVGSAGTHILAVSSH